MLRKSKKSAIVMGSIVFFATDVALMIVRIVPDWLSGRLSADMQPAALTVGETAIGVVAALFLVVFRVGLYACLIYLLNETHFGWQGAIRWAIFGVLVVLLFEISLSVLPDSNSFLLNELTGLIRAAVIVVLSYWLVFKLFPLAQSGDRRVNPPSV